MAEYHSISDLVKLSTDNNQELWQVVLTGQAHESLCLKEMYLHR